MNQASFVKLSTFKIGDNSYGTIIYSIGQGSNTSIKYVRTIGDSTKVYTIDASNVEVHTNIQIQIIENLPVSSSNQNRESEIFALASFSSSFRSKLRLVLYSILEENLVAWAAHDTENISFDDTVNSFQIIRIDDYVKSGQTKLRLLLFSGYETNIYSFDISYALGARNVVKPIVGALEISDLYSNDEEIQKGLFKSQILINPVTAVIRCKSVLDYPEVIEDTNIATCFVITETYYSFKLGVYFTQSKKSVSLELKTVLTTMPNTTPQDVDFNDETVKVTVYSYMLKSAFTMMYYSKEQPQQQLKNQLILHTFDSQKCMYTELFQFNSFLSQSIGLVRIKADGSAGRGFSIQSIQNLMFKIENIDCDEGFDKLESITLDNLDLSQSEPFMLNKIFDVNLTPKSSSSSGSSSTGGSDEPTTEKGFFEKYWVLILIIFLVLALGSGGLVYYIVRVKSKDTDKIKYGDSVDADEYERNSDLRKDDKGRMLRRQSEDGKSVDQFGDSIQTGQTNSTYRSMDESAL